MNLRYWQAGKNHVCVWRYKVASCKRASLKSTRFSQQQKIRSDTFLMSSILFQKEQEITGTGKAYLFIIKQVISFTTGIRQFSKSVYKASIEMCCLGAIHKLRHMNFMIFLPLPHRCHRWSHFLDSPYLVLHRIFCNFTPRNYYIKTAIPKLILFLFKLFFSKINIKSNIGIYSIYWLNIRRLTKFSHMYELARHRIALSEHWVSYVYIGCSMCNVQCFSMELFQFGW